MEDQIRKAEGAKSKCGEFCKIIGVITVTAGTVLLVNNLFTKNSQYKDVFFFITGGAALTALGNNATSNKRTAELTALLARATNSASQLPTGDPQKNNNQKTLDYLKRV